MICNRAIYHDGWVACSHFGTPWDAASRGGDFLKAPWELYHIEEDFSQANDLADQNPEKLKELQEQFLRRGPKVRRPPARSPVRRTIRSQAARRRRATDLVDLFRQQRLAARADRSAALPARSSDHGRRPTSREGGAEGVVTCAGAFSAGWSLYVKDGKPNFRYTCFEIADVDDPRDSLVARGRCDHPRRSSSPTVPRRAAGR